MKIAKAREKSKLLMGLEFLNRRILLTEKDKRLLLNLEKGFDGEIEFDKRIETYLNNEMIVLNDLLLVNNGMTFQMDSLIITSETIYIYEVKNYSGNYLMNSGELMTSNGIEVNNPLLQRARIEHNIFSLLKEWGLQYKVEVNVLFINSAFTLYQARIEDPIILPTQIKSHLLEINNTSKLLTKNNHFLANKLIRLHDSSLPFQKQLPIYTYDHCKKGLSCSKCGSFDLILSQRSSLCKDCDQENSVEEVILKNIEEFMFLFPEKKVTTQVVVDWCGDKISVQRIRKILKDHFTVIGLNKSTYYE